MATPVREQPTRETREAVIYRVDSAVFWVFAAALGVGVLLLMALNGSAIHDTIAAQLALAPGWLAFVCLLVWIILRFDPWRSARRYPQALVAGAALGGTTAMVMAIYGNDALTRVWSLVVPSDVIGDWSAALTAPIVEEASKALCAAVILQLSAPLLNRISHAMVLGMFVGLGFDVVEDLTYAAGQAIGSLDSDLVGAGDTLGVRILTAVPSHWAYTSLSAVGVLLLMRGYSWRADWSRRRRIVTACGLFAAAWFMHFLWDSPVPSGLGALAGAVLLAKIVINLVVFGTSALLLMRPERRQVRDRIERRRDDRDDPLSGIRPDVLDSVGTYRARRALRTQARKDGGRPAARQIRLDQRRALDLLQAGW
jgi:protease PrsW